MKASISRIYISQQRPMGALVASHSTKWLTLPKAATRLLRHAGPGCGIRGLPIGTYRSRS